MSSIKRRVEKLETRRAAADDSQRVIAVVDGRGMTEQEIKQALAEKRTRLASAPAIAFISKDGIR